MNSERKDNSTPHTIPSSMKELEGVPPEYVSVYMTVPWEYIEGISQHGLSVENNQMQTRNPQLEEIFRRVGEQQTLYVSRTRCLFAYPRHLHEMAGYGPKEPDTALLELVIDPNGGAIVVDGELYHKSGRALRMNWSSGVEEAALLAVDYWEGALLLSDYLFQIYNNTGFVDFEWPEVLVPSDLPVSHVKILEV